MAKTTTNKLATNMEKSTTNNRFWTSCSWIIRITVKILPWLMLLHNLLYIVFPGPSNDKSVSDLAWSNFISVVYLIGMQAWIDGGLSEV